MERAELARHLGRTGTGQAQTALPPRCVMEGTPAAFMTAFAAAVAGGGEVLLGDPQWGTREQAQLATILAAGARPDAPEGGATPERGWLALPTGGSSGQLKFARHDGETLAAAVAGFQQHFGVTRVQAVGVLPLYHVSGFMAWMRCALSGGRYQPWDWKRLATGDVPPIPAGDWFLSLVPTQLQRLLGQPGALDWFRRFRAVFVGGGPAWPDLLDAAATARLPLAISYGMTETAAMITALRPEEFLQGRRSCGSPLPHARLSLADDGVVCVQADSLFRGYYPAWRPGRAWRTEDLGHFDELGQLHLDGRRDAVIITGGKKVAPAEVESALRATGWFSDIAVIGLPDPVWGETVVACYPAGDRPPTGEAIGVQLAPLLAPHKRPKRYLALSDWPRNAQGKLHRPTLLARVQARETRHAGDAS